MRTSPAAPSPEQLDVRTADGWSLRADVHEPAGEAVGIAVLAHALMARRSEFDRPRGAGLAHYFAERGWRVVTFDFRGHGDSSARAGGRASFAYDDFVTRDLPAVHAFARSRARRKQPVVLVGHSLGGHTALAAQGVGLVAFDRIVGVAASPWLRNLEPSRARWLVKRGLLAAAVATARKLGRLPARSLRLGSDDEAVACVEDLDRFARTGRWTSLDGRADYLASLARVKVPVLQLASDGDRIECPPECAVRFVARCGGPHEVVRLGGSGFGQSPPDHMGIVTSSRARGAWDPVEAWMRRAEPAESTPTAPIDSLRT